MLKPTPTPTLGRRLDRLLGRAVRLLLAATAALALHTLRLDRMGQPPADRRRPRPGVGGRDRAVIRISVDQLGIEIYRD
jgi:hypothetical protein